VLLTCSATWPLLSDASSSIMPQVLDIEEAAPRLPTGVLAAPQQQQCLSRHVILAVQNCAATRLRLQVRVDSAWAPGCKQARAHCRLPVHTVVKPAAVVQVPGSGRSIALDYATNASAWALRVPLTGSIARRLPVLELGLLQEVSSLVRRFMGAGTQAGALSSSCCAASALASADLREATSMQSEP
jgi:hypothetical protein